MMDFYKRIAVVLRRLPEGKVTTYGQIALLCGKPGNSRQVGYGLKHDLAGQVPAYRVVNSRGILSGASHFDTPDLQKLLLEKDGIPVTWTPDGWRVDLKQYQWRNTLEDALALEREMSYSSIVSPNPNS